MSWVTQIGCVFPDGSHLVLYVLYCQKSETIAALVEECCEPTISGQQLNWTAWTGSLLERDYSPTDWLHRLVRVCRLSSYEGVRYMPCEGDAALNNIIECYKYWPACWFRYSLWVLHFLQLCCTLETRCSMNVRGSFIWTSISQSLDSFFVPKHEQ